MRTIIFILISLILTSCKNINEPTQEQKDAKHASFIEEFNYKDHNYILYKSSLDYGSYSGIVHNPDCKCKHKEENE